MTFLFYLNNYNVRQCKAQYSWVLQLASKKNLDAYFIFPVEYFNLNKEYLTNYEYTITERLETTIEQTKDEYGSFRFLTPSKILDISVNCVIKEQQEAIQEAIRDKNIEAAITWVNNKTLESTLGEFGIPVIHQEAGPFRAPVYNHTFYFDFSGVNGNTEFDKRFEDFLKIADEVPILERKSLIRILSPNYYRELWKVLDNNNYEYEIGVGLQVEEDTNLLLFNGGNNWFDPVLQAKSETTGQILVRPHPLAKFSLSPNEPCFVIDKGSRNNRAYNFINKCKKIYCLNSSVGLEALLLGRKSVIFGENPFSNVCMMDEETQLKALNFIIFGYLIHSDLHFNNDYYRFRLKNRGNEKLIYLDNLNRFLKNTLKKG